MNEQEMVRILEKVGVETVLTKAVELKIIYDYSPAVALEKALLCFSPNKPVSGKQSQEC